MSIVYQGNLTIDLDNGEVKVNHSKIYLTNIEYNIIEALAIHEFITWKKIDDILNEESKIRHPKKWVFSSTNPFEVPETVITIVNRLKFCGSNINLKLSEDGIKLGIIDKYSMKLLRNLDEITETEKSVNSLRDQIKRDMEDYKLLCSRTPNTFGDEYKPVFDEEIHMYFKGYLKSRIKENIEKLRGINKC